MSALSPAQVDNLLGAAGPGATVYLLGVGGCGVSGLAHLLLDLGYGVHGSDLLANTEIRELQERGAVIHQGHAAKNLAAAKPVLVVYSSAVRLPNPELHLATEMHIPIVRRAVLLAALLRRKRGVCVAGMHGKTTTTALLSHALEHLQANPSYAIGALVPQLRRHARFIPGDSSVVWLSPGRIPEKGGQQINPQGQDLFVIEADESDGTLREFFPEFAIVLNIDEEHLDYYVNLQAIVAAFGQFCEQTRQTVVYCADDAGLTELLADHPRALSYGRSANATYRFVPVSAGLKNGLEVWKGKSLLGQFALGLLGEQNISNACAVVAFLDHLGYGAKEIAEAISGFKGAARRQQELFVDDRFRIFEDYGHHPAEIEATLRAFKGIGARRLLVAFQPHRFTRTRFLLKQFSTCFQQADRLWVTEIYAASESEITGVNGSLLADAIRGQGQAVDFVASLDDLAREVRAALEPGDIVLFLGAGDITMAAHDLAAQLKKESVPKENAAAARRPRLAVGKSCCGHFAP